MNDIHKYITNRKRHGKFFLAFADKRLFFRLARFHLATNELPQKASGFMRRALTNHKFIFIPYQGCHYFCHYPTTNLFVFFRYFAGMGASNLHVMFIGLEPLCET